MKFILMIIRKNITTASVDSHTLLLAALKKDVSDIDVLLKRCQNRYLQIDSRSILQKIKR